MGYFSLERITAMSGMSEYLESIISSSALTLFKKKNVLKRRFCQAGLTTLVQNFVYKNHSLILMVGCCQSERSILPSEVYCTFC